MPLRVTDLQPGDRVIINCPKARRLARREVEFRGILTAAEIQEWASGGGGAVYGKIEPDARYAEFLLRTVDTATPHDLLDEHGQRHRLPDYRIVRHSCLMRIVGDGLKDDENRTVFIERRLARPAMG